MLWSVMLLAATAAKGSCPEVMGKKWFKRFLNNSKAMFPLHSRAMSSLWSTLAFTQAVKHSFKSCHMGLKNPWAQCIFQGDFFPLGMNTTTHVSHSTYIEGAIVGSCLFIFLPHSWKRLLENRQVVASRIFSEEVLKQGLTTAAQCTPVLPLLFCWRRVMQSHGFLDF